MSAKFLRHEGYLGAVGAFLLVHPAMNRLASASLASASGTSIPGTQVTGGRSSTLPSKASTADRILCQQGPVYCQELCLSMDRFVVVMVAVVVCVFACVCGGLALRQCQAPPIAPLWYWGGCGTLCDGDNQQPLKPASPARCLSGLEMRVRI
jgi:hypothetical protein